MLRVFLAIAIAISSLTASAEMGPAARHLLVGRSIPAPTKPACDESDGPLRVAERVVGGISVCERRFGKNTPDDVNCFDRQSAVDLLRPAGIRDNLNSLAEQMFFQDLASNSMRQSTCRLNFINAYLKPGETQNLTNGRAEEEFDKVHEKIRTLIEYRAKLAKEKEEWTTVANGAAGRGGADLRERANAYGKMIAEVNETIYRFALAIPMAHETEVLNAIERMATTGRFDAREFQNAVVLSSRKYESSVAYFKRRERPVGRTGKVRYCADDDFRHHAGKSGEIRRWISSMPASSESEERFKNRLSCRLDAQYESGPANLQTGVMISGFVLGIATLGTSVAAEAGIGGAIAAGTWMTAASTGIDAVALAMASNAVRRDCFPPTISLAPIEINVTRKRSFSGRSSSATFLRARLTD